MRDRLLDGRPWVLVLLLFGLYHPLQAQESNQAGLVVVHGDGRVVSQCVAFGPETISGLELLTESGLDLNVDASNAMGAAVCRIDQEGCSYPQQDCFCQCQGSPCIYWSYWEREGSEWAYSSLGAANTVVGHGDMNAWVWDAGTIGRDAEQEPPDLDFEEVCAPATPTPAPTETATTAPASTSTVESPTSTPAPVDPPVIHYFEAERTSIQAGESTRLRWDLSAAEAAYLRFDGQEAGVIAPDSREVTPQQTTTYVLAARNAGGEVQAEVTIQVTSPPAAEESAPQPTSQPTAQSPTPLPTAVPPQAAATSTPEIVAQAATAEPAPTSTPAPTLTPTSTPTQGWRFFATTPVATAPGSSTPGPTRVAEATQVYAPDNSSAAAGSDSGASTDTLSRPGLAVSTTVLIGGLITLGLPLAALLLLFARRRR